MSEPAMLADHLDEQTDAILAVWRATVERDGDVPEAERLSYGEFLDHVPALLDRLAERLRGRPADAVDRGQEARRAPLAAGLRHRRDRHRVRPPPHRPEPRHRSSYAREHGWDLDRLEAALEAINDVLDEATAESVRQFQEDSQAETRAALAEVKSRQTAVEEASVLARSEQAKLGTILRSLPAAVWVVDAEGTIVGTNDEAERIQGFAVDPAFVGRANVHDLGPEYRIRRPDGPPTALRRPAAPPRPAGRDRAPGGAASG